MADYYLVFCAWHILQAPVYSGWLARCNCGFAEYLCAPILSRLVYKHMSMALLVLGLLSKRWNKLHDYLRLVDLFLSGMKQDSTAFLSPSVIRADRQISLGWAWLKHGQTSVFGNKLFLWYVQLTRDWGKVVASWRVERLWVLRLRKHVFASDARNHTRRAKHRVISCLSGCVDKSSWIRLPKRLFFRIFHFSSSKVYIQICK